MYTLLAAIAVQVAATFISGSALTGTSLALVFALGLAAMHSDE